MKMSLSAGLLALASVSAYAGDVEILTDQIQGFQLVGTPQCNYERNVVHAADRFGVIRSVGGFTPFAEVGGPATAWMDADGHVFVRSANRQIVRVGRLIESERPCPDTANPVFAVEQDPALQVTLTREWAGLCTPWVDASEGVVWRRSYQEVLRLSDRVQQVVLSIGGSRIYSTLQDCKSALH
jgi:hypothetical protein